MFLFLYCNGVLRLIESFILIFFFWYKYGVFKCNILGYNIFLLTCYIVIILLSVCSDCCLRILKYFSIFLYVSKKSARDLMFTHENSYSKLKNHKKKIHLSVLNT